MPYGTRLPTASALSIACTLALATGLSLAACGDETTSSSGGDGGLQTDSAMPAGGGRCGKGAMALAEDAGDPPAPYGSAWTPAPIEGCTFEDADGRRVELTAAQHRMLFRLDELRALQSESDETTRPDLEPDYCLHEFAQDFAATNPTEHSEMNTRMYELPNCERASGQYIFGESLGITSGYDDPLAAVDRRIAGWWGAGDPTTGNRANVLDPEWTKVGVGLYFLGRTTAAVATFSRGPANWRSGWTPCSRPPTTEDPESTIPEPLPARNPFATDCGPTVTE